MVQIAAPIIEAEEIAAVNRVLKSGGLAQGPVVAQLEADFAAYCGTKYAVAVNSGTAALHAALHGIGVGPGTEVITTPFSFIATINPILMQGAEVRLVDIEPDSFNLDPANVRAAITPATRAIVAVDLYGQPYQYDELNEIATEHNLSIVEDACQAVGAKFGDRKAGSLGRVGAFSLYATKNIMSGEGGVLTTDDEAVMKAAKSFRQHGMTGPYEYGGMGYNYRLTDLLASIGVEQLRKADEFNWFRQRNAELLTSGLADIPGIVTPPVLPNRIHVYHQYTIRVQASYGHSREALMGLLKAEGIGSGIYYPKPLHYYGHIAKLGYHRGDFPIAEQAAREVLSLPVHPGVNPVDIERMTQIIRNNAR